MAEEAAAAVALDEVRPGRGRCAVALRDMSEGEVALTEAPVAWGRGSNSTGLGEYAGGAVQLEFFVPPGATVFAFTV